MSDRPAPTPGPHLERVLDRLAWHALTGRQAQFAEGSGPARRYRRDVGMFAGIEDLTPRSWDGLAAMVGEGGVAVLFQSGVDELPPGWHETFRMPTYQMVAGSAVTVTPPDGIEIVELGEDDADEMVALTALTEPGPFFAGTQRLGTYLGVREEGRLIAMAGERMQADGVAEISAVCTHPDARRRGLAALLTAAMVDLMHQRGDVAILHVATINTAAIPVYEQLGFTVRTSLNALAARFGQKRP